MLRIFKLTTGAVFFCALCINPMGAFFALDAGASEAGQCRYVVQIASGQDRTLVEKQTADLQKEGMDVRWEKTTTNGVEGYRIVTGCFESSRQAMAHMVSSGLLDDFRGSFIKHGLPVMSVPLEETAKKPLSVEPIDEKITQTELGEFHEVESEAPDAITPESAPELAPILEEDLLVGEELIAPSIEPPPDPEIVPAESVACRYLIQLASGQNKALVEKQTATLQKKGMDVRWEKKVTRETDWYRIVAGCFESPRRARQYMASSGLSDGFPGSFVGRGQSVTVVRLGDTVKKPPSVEPIDEKITQTELGEFHEVESEAPDAITPESAPELAPILEEDLLVGEELIAPSIEPPPDPEIVPAESVACRYLIQLASGQDKALVEKQTTALQKKGMDVRWEKKITKGADWYRIITGCFESPRRARNFMASSGLSDGFPGSFVGRGQPVTVVLLRDTVKRPVSVEPIDEKVTQTEVGEFHEVESEAPDAITSELAPELAPILEEDLLVEEELIEPSIEPSPDPEIVPAESVACRYVIQIASGQDEATMEEERALLQKKGTDVRLEKKITGSVNWYRIITGCFESPEEAMIYMASSGLLDEYRGSFVRHGLPVIPVPSAETVEESPSAETADDEIVQAKLAESHEVKSEVPEMIEAESPPEPAPAQVVQLLEKEEPVEEVKPMPPPVKPAPGPETMLQRKTESEAAGPDESIEPGGSKGFRFRLGLGYARIGETVNAKYKIMSPQLEVIRDLYPLIGMGYHFTDRFAIRADFRYDYYAWEIYKETLTLYPAVDSTFYGFSLSISPVVYSRELRIGPTGQGRFMASVGIGYSWLESDFDFPVLEYEPAFGAELSLGCEWEKWGFELGYRLYEHDANSLKPGFKATSENDTLDLSGVYIQTSYAFGQ